MTGAEMEKAVRRYLKDPSGVKFGTWTVAGSPNVAITGPLEEAVERLLVVLPFNALGNSVKRTESAAITANPFTRPAGLRFANHQVKHLSPADQKYYVAALVRGPVDQAKEDNAFIKATQKYPRIYEVALEGGSAGQEWNIFPDPAGITSGVKVKYDVVAAITASSRLSASSFMSSEYTTIPADLHPLVIKTAAYHMFNTIGETEMADLFYKTDVLPILKIYGVRSLEGDNR